eukprot:14075724-Alexandrium_andersonii.AAC.1
MPTKQHPSPPLCPLCKSTLSHAACRSAWPAWHIATPRHALPSPACSCTSAIVKSIRVEAFGYGRVLRTAAGCYRSASIKSTATTHERHRSGDFGLLLQG